MRRDPAERHQSVTELREELEAAFSASGGGIGAEPRVGTFRGVTSILLIVPLVSLAVWLFLSI